MLIDWKTVLINRANLLSGDKLIDDAFLFSIHPSSKDEAREEDGPEKNDDDGEENICI